MIAATLSGDLSKFQALTHALAAPFTPDPTLALYEAAPTAAERVTQTFCGT
jgi:uncharacterized protein YdiU (UPF0061 family)